MFSSLFNRKPILLEVNLNLSKYSGVEILKKGQNLTDKEYILLGLLTYARLLRLFRFKKIDPKNAPYTFFIEASKTRSNFQNDIDFLKKVSDSIHIMKNIYEKETTLKIICRGDKNSDKVIYTGIPKSQELGSYVYTIYSFVQSNIKEQNKIVAFQLFTALSKLKMTKELTGNDAINFPNLAVNESHII